MIPIEDLPAESEDLAEVRVDFPRLSPDSPKGCPVPMADIMEYLRIESADLDTVRREDLVFLRTALVADHRYWIWAFTESDGAQCYVTVSLSADGRMVTGLAENYYELSPEQHMLGEYYQFF